MQSTRHLLIAAVVLFAAGSSAASSSAPIIVPPVRVEAPDCVALVGSLAGVPASLGRFQVTVRDIANNPLNNATVVVDLSRCGDLRLCADPLDPTIVVDCAARTAVSHTNALGIATFTLLGGSLGYSTAAPSSRGAMGRIFVPPYPDYGVDVAVNACDLDGFQGVGAHDFSLWLTDFGSGVPWARSDYDCSGEVGANDLALWLEVFGEGLMSNSCASLCP